MHLSLVSSSGPVRALACRAARVLVPAISLLLVPPTIATGQDPTGDAALQEENARLQAENERLRSELENLRGQRPAASADAPATTSATGASGAAPAPTSGAPARRADDSSSVEAEYVSRSRVSLTVVRSDAGEISLIATPWYRTENGGGLLPVRDQVQLRAVPGRDGAPPRVWLTVQRDGVQGTLSAVDRAQLRIDGWTAQAPVVDHDLSRRRRRSRSGAIPPPRDERAVFALPSAALGRLAVAEQATFEAGAFRFQFTDDHVGAAAALSARLAREEKQP